MRQPCWRIWVIQSDCCLLWRVWLRTLNLVLVGGNPYYIPCHLILFVYFIFVFVVFFRSTVFCHSSLGKHSPTLHQTCAAHLELYFLTHWGECAILVWGWGKHFCLFIWLFLLFVCVKKKCVMLLIGHELHHNCGLPVIGVFNLFEHCKSLESQLFDSCVGLERLHLFDWFFDMHISIEYVRYEIWLEKCV